jgi:hypothetical protein
MAAIEFLPYFLGINPNILTKAEKIILEADLLGSICKELKEIFKSRYKNYFYLIKQNYQMEENMLDRNYLHWVVEDILSTGEYTLPGIAYYTQTPEEIVHDILVNSHSNPSATFLQRIIALHQEVRPEIYFSIRKKIAEYYLAAA